MRLVRRLWLLAAAAAAIFGLAASSAHPQVEVITEPGDEHCPDVSVVQHAVAGGCYMEFASTVDVPLHAYVPQKVTVSSCEMHLEGRIGPSGEGYVTEAVLDPPHAGAVPCTRETCEEVEAPENHVTIPWPIHVRETPPGSEQVELEFCLQTVGGEGAGNWCELRLPFTEIGSHLYELGELDAPGDPTEAFCENNPNAGYSGPHSILSAPVSLEAHFEATGTDYEVVH